MNRVEKQMNPKLLTHNIRNQKAASAAIKSRMTKLLLTGAAFSIFSGVPLRADSDDAFLPTPPLIVSTVPTNGDLNPYGVAFVPQDFHNGSGPLQPRDILVSNFNNSGNLQGTGTTIVRVPANGGPVSTFFTAIPAAPGATGYGLSTALAVLRKGFVIVGSVPSVDGTAATAGPGGLLVIDNNGHLVSTITDPLINGPWDMTMQDGGDQATVFISSVFTGTVVRLDLHVATNGVTVTKKTVIASGYQHRSDPVAFEVGPTGLVYEAEHDVLYVASTEDNAVFAVGNAAEKMSDGGTGRIIYSDTTHLHGPLGLAEAPNGHLLVANSDVINSDPNQPSEIVEFTVRDKFIKQLSVDPAQGGSFGLAVMVNHDAAIFAAVDDNTPSLIVWTLPLP